MALKNTCSVIIPTYNNERVLPQTLQTLFRQHVLPGWEIEVLICDNGSYDHTLRVAQAVAPPRPWRVSVWPGVHQGSAQARNRGIAQATGDIIFFLGADILLRPLALRHHLVFHTQHAALTEAALGYVAWDPRLRPTPLMEWMVHGGPQNDFDSLLNGSLADPGHFFYGSHVSLKRELLSDGGFAPEFTSYGWEDLELGWRLAKQGLRLTVLWQAQALHHHFYTPNAICRRQIALGQGIGKYQQLHPEVTLGSQSTRRRYVKYWLAWYSGGAFGLRLLTRLLSSRLALPKLFALVTTLYWWRGVFLASSFRPVSNKLK